MAETNNPDTTTTAAFLGAYNALAPEEREAAQDFIVAHGGSDAWMVWQGLSLEERRDTILGHYTASVWLDQHMLPVLAHFRLDPVAWARIKARYTVVKGNAWDLEKAVDGWRGSQADTSAADALIESLRFPFLSHSRARVPELPTRASYNYSDLSLSLLCPWIEGYIAHSTYWAPRAAPSYHQAVALWVLSTVAARRIVVHLGSTPVYATLFLAMVSESTHWTKTTAAMIGVQLLRRSGCGHLLAPDRTTPQFLLKLMSGLVPQDYGKRDEDAQRQAREALGFAAQRGWFYEEWGGMLHLMRRTDSPHAELNKLLIVLEGGAPSFETGTIQRGLERVEAPYLALLGNATQRDLVGFMEPGNPWWHDGFWPRFACVTPAPGAQPSRAPRPRETYHLPASLIVPLHDWHTRLGMPEVCIEAEEEKNGKQTGGWVGTVGPLPCQALTLAPDVYDAYETYNDALIDLVHAGDVLQDLSPWYGRAHEKALRVAMLLVSVAGEAIITLPYWIQAQAIVEGWRHSLHDLIATLGEVGPASREAQLESRITQLCAQSGGMTAREMQRHLKGQGSEVLHKTLTSMVRVGALVVRTLGKKQVYLFLDEEG